MDKMSDYIASLC